MFKVVRSPDPVTLRILGDAYQFNLMVLTAWHARPGIVVILGCRRPPVEVRAAGASCGSARAGLGQGLGAGVA